MGYAVRSVRAGSRSWTSPPSPAVLRDMPSRYGLPILFPFPGDMRGGTYQWAGQEHVVPPTYPTGSDPEGATIVIHGFAHIRPWRFVEQDADRIVLEFRDARRARPCPRRQLPVHGQPDATRSARSRRPHQRARRPRTRARSPRRSPSGCTRTSARTCSGRTDPRSRSSCRGARRAHAAAPGPGMSGEREPAPPGPVSIVPSGERMIASRTDFPPARPWPASIDLAPIDGRRRLDHRALDGRWLPRSAALRAAGPGVDLAGAADPHAGRRLAAGGSPRTGWSAWRPGQTRTARARIRLVPPPFEREVAAEQGASDGR